MGGELGAFHIHVVLPASRRAHTQFKNNLFTEMCSGAEAGSCLRRIDSCIAQLKAQGPSRTCNESKEEEEDTACQLENRWST